MHISKALVEEINVQKSTVPVFLFLICSSHIANRGNTTLSFSVGFTTLRPSVHTEDGTYSKWGWGVGS